MGPFTSGISFRSRTQNLVSQNENVEAHIYGALIKTYLTHMHVLSDVDGLGYAVGTKCHYLDPHVSHDAIY